jgi:hypothetical protein
VHRSFRHYSRNGRYPDRTVPVYLHPAAPAQPDTLLKQALEALERLNAQRTPLPDSIACEAIAAIKEALK